MSLAATKQGKSTAYGINFKEKTKERNITFQDSLQPSLCTAPSIMLSCSGTGELPKPHKFSQIPTHLEKTQEYLYFSSLFVCGGTEHVCPIEMSKTWEINNWRWYFMNCTGSRAPSWIGRTILIGRIAAMEKAAPKLGEENLGWENFNKISWVGGAKFLQ